MKVKRNTCMQTRFTLHQQGYLIYFHLLEVVGRGSYRDPQLQVGKNSLFDLRPNIFKSLCANTHFIPNNCDLVC